MKLLSTEINYNSKRISSVLNHVTRRCVTDDIESTKMGCGDDEPDKQMWTFREGQNKCVVITVDS